VISCPAGRKSGRRNQRPDRLVESWWPPLGHVGSSTPVNGFVADPIWKIESGAAAPSKKSVAHHLMI
jgi:hypothetical protein